MLNEINLSRIDLNLLVLFEVVLKERHVGRAAEKLNLSPSAVSHGLGRLRRLLNDPLFLKMPKGVVPTARATELAEPIADILLRVGRVVSSAAPFDPSNSTRRFIVGAPDGVSAVLLPKLLSELQHISPRVDIGVRQLLPTPGEISPDRAWRNAFAELERRDMDIAVLPSEHIPPRFHKRLLFDEDFVVVMRAGHPFAPSLSLERYCDAKHLVVSLTGDAYGFVDRVLQEQGRSRRVALTAPNFMLALPLVAESDMIAAVPRRFAAMHASRFGLDVKEAPLPLGRFQLNAVVSKAAMMDIGVSWLLQVIGSTVGSANKPRPRAPRNRKASKKR
jgi:DNA-binding transcriptional LysR family regulator